MRRLEAMDDKRPQRKKHKRQKLESNIEMVYKEKKDKINQLDQYCQGFKTDPTGQGYNYTVSMAVPGSILDNAQSRELRTYLAGQIARAAAVFRVQEVIVFDDQATHVRRDAKDFTGMGKTGDCNIQLARILQYLECPQYLRKSFFPKHHHLQYAGLLNPLDGPHHARDTDDTSFREGIVLSHAIKPGKGSLVDVGIKKNVQIDRVLEEGMRVTVRMIDSLTSERKKLRGKVVSADIPWREAGIYWGYTVRIAPSLSAVLSESPYAGGYDVTLGTSDKGQDVAGVRLAKFKHALVVFGGLDGIEAALESDESLSADDPRDLFTHYINTCPNQGSRTIRTEEAILITLAALQSQLSQGGSTCHQGT